MKRDMDLAREILFAIEKSAKPDAWVELKIPGYEERQVYYHVMLLNEAGLIDAMDVSTIGEDGFEWQATRLTWQGHDFLDAARSDTVWRRAKDKTAKVAGSVSFEVMKELLVSSAREIIGMAA